MNKKGFTLLELLTVISILGLLVLVSVGSYNGVQKSGRDARRKADLEQIRLGLELYRNTNSTYPTTGTDPISILCTATPNNGIRDPSPGGTNIYLDKTPHDPKCVGTGGYRYYYSGLAADYTLCAYLEKGGTTYSGTICSATGSTTVCNYCLGPYGPK